MTDFMTPEQRRRCMSRVRSKNTKPEILLRKELWRAGLRFRLKSNLPGRPDIVFPGKRVAIFVDGCFWHGCPKHGAIPKTNTDYWMNKITRNVQRDRENIDELQKMGWKTIRVWEHEINEDVFLVTKFIESLVKKL